MTKSLIKDFQREIKKSKSRFISIMLIVALGVAFYSGVRSSLPAMYLTADASYDKENLMDIRVVGTLGLTDSDIEAIKQVEGIHEIEGSFTTDFLCFADSKEIVTRAVSMTDTINDVTLIEGEYPEVYNQCLVSREFLDESGFKVGDVLKLSSGDGEDIKKSLATESYKIVGVCSSSYYLNGKVGTSNIGDGMADAYVVIPKQAFVTEAYTSVYITVADAKGLNSFGKDYKDIVNGVIEKIEEISGRQCDIRYTEVRSVANDELDKAERQFTTEKLNAEDNLKNAHDKLTAQKALIESSYAEIQENKNLLANAEEYLPIAEKEVADAEAKIAGAKVQIQTAKQTLEEAKVSLQDAETELRKIEQDPNSTPQDVEKAKKTLALINLGVQTAEKEIASQELQIEQGERDLIQAKVTVGQLRQALANKGELENAEQEIISADTLLKQSEAEYNTYREQVFSELEKAEDQIEDMRNKVSNIEVPIWYVLDRKGIESHASYVSESDSIAAIGAVFPLIFFFVAALVSLTTMTRMVEEERIQIGTLKALGYDKVSIVAKYILYAAAATVAGSVLGTIVGELLIPPMIIGTYRAVYYNLGPNVVKFNFWYAFLAGVTAIVFTTLATFLACYRSLRSEPASLMRPEAPKAGKRTFVENFPGIWQRLNFGQKAAVRNLFRYKKRFFMTLFGVGGCMALLLVGLGIRDSVSAVADNQYGEVFNYNAVVSVDPTITKSERRTLLDKMSDSQMLEGILLAHRNIVSASGESESEFKDEIKAYLIVPTNVEEFPKYVNLQERTGDKEQINLLTDGVIITEKYADLLGVKENDYIYIKLDDSRVTPKEVKVLGITENYIFNYIYMTPAMYESLYGTVVDMNMFMLKTARGVDMDELKSTFSAFEGVNSVITNKEELEDINEVIKNLYFIIFLMIGSAALLAFVVLYNLNNINISERRRELATFKVLGFTNSELATYVYRENVILTALGIIVGTITGVILHRIVMITVETDMYMFGRELNFASIVLATLLTILFTVIINEVMRKKLQKIDMIESLKSVE